MKLKRDKVTANTIATKTIQAANEAGRTLVVLRFTEKLSDAKNSGAEVGGLGRMIEEVESWGWTMTHMVQENDQRTLGDRAVFYLTFRRDEDNAIPPPPPA